MGLEDFGEISARLQGVEFSYSAIEKALKGIKLEAYFGTSNKEDILNFLAGRSE